MIWSFAVGDGWHAHIDDSLAMGRNNIGLQAAVDLEKQEVAILGTEPTVYHFDIDPAAKEQLIKGLDDIDQTLRYEADITRFEKEYEPF